MQKIQLLDQKTINKIAAGEVVESPKSVVKELTENAMDAGASTVTVEIKEGGISYIRVTDNGCGIPKEQVKEAFLRHATSKLSQIEDLEHLYTMGFRGEALASIAAVSQVEMTTRTKDEETGTRIEISAGEVKSFQDVACTEGTTVIVRNLFYNVPARRKFLKKPATESGYVSDLMNKLALGHPELSFRYINNGSTMLHTAGNGDAKASVFYVYGKEAATSMMEISFERGDYRLSGLIGKPELSRGNRNYENLFINGRFIKNRIVSSAVENAYKTRIMIGKFPVYVLNLEVDAAQVDVNVHPAKLEVRFKNDDEVYDFFYDAISSAFQDQVLIPRSSWEKKPAAEPKPKVEQQSLVDMILQRKAELPEMPAEEEQVEPEKTIATEKSVLIEKPTTEKTYHTPLTDLPKAGSGPSVDQLLKWKQPERSVVREDVASYTAETPVVPADFAVDGISEEKPVEKVETPLQKQAFFHNYKIIGQIFRTYWMVEQGDCVYLIDQHAAHERILYENLMNQFRQESVISQRLVSPVMLRLTPMETQILKDNRELLERFGFGFEVFGNDTFGLNAVPVLLKEPSGVGFFTEILDAISDGTVSNVYDTKILAVATMACKAAVKGHDRLSIQEAESLISQLLKLENPFTCPHGRPTIIELTRYELEKKFKRIQN